MRFRRSLLVVISLGLITSSAGAQVVSTKPLHVTLDVSDSVSGKTARIEHYFEPQRHIAIAGTVTIVTDYAQQTITRIDRTAGTYSVALRNAPSRPSLASKAASKINTLTPVTIAGHHADVVEFQTADGAAMQRTRVASTSDVGVTQLVAETIFGSTAGIRYERSTLDALRLPSAMSAGETSYRLPLEISMAIDIDNETVESRSTVVSVGNDRIEAERAAIPQGARRVAPPPDLDAALRDLNLPASR